MRSLVLACTLASVVLGGCAAGPGLRARPGVGEARVAHYADSDGLGVSTLTARVAQPLSHDASIDVRALADHIVVKPQALNAGHTHGPNQPTGHKDADVVTSASSTVAGGRAADKWRYEGTLGGNVSGYLAARPWSVRATARVSSEVDYFSYGGTLRGSMELFERNLTLSAFAGYGHDTVTPLEAPPGQASEWPATHARVNGGITASQILSPRIVLSGGVSTNLQSGMLSNPYRRALVRTSLFPELVPTTRERVTAFVGIALHLGWRSALHLQQGAYADGWGVRATIPEITLAREIGASSLVAVRYRYYGQTDATFYRARYAERAPLLSGDPRLGRLHEHSAGIDLQTTLVGRPGEFGSLLLFGSYSLASLRFDSLRAAAIRSSDVVSHTGSLGASLAY